MEILEQLLKTFFSSFSMFISPIFLIPLIIVAIILIKNYKDYKNSAYYKITKISYFSVKRDIGRYGEYLTYKYLKDFEKRGAKFLFNVYIPKENGETTEIDLLMICSKGIFVFESKNYSGWIFGSENQKNWYQTLPKGRNRSHKEHFYNPIMQNRSHIKHLKAFLGEEIPMKSIIVFSERCTLKDIQIKSDDISVINRYDIAVKVSNICEKLPARLLSEKAVEDIYNRLYPYTQVDIVTKEQHITNIHNNLNEKYVQQAPTTTLKTGTSQAFAIEHPEITFMQSEFEKTENGTDNKILATTESATENDAEPKLLKCPKCNGDLILRTAMRGANVGNRFYGCSNYPKCKYVQNVINDTSK